MENPVSCVWKKGDSSTRKLNKQTTVMLLFAVHFDSVQNNNSLAQIIKVRLVYIRHSNGPLLINQLDIIMLCVLYAINVNKTMVNETNAN